MEKRVRGWDDPRIMTINGLRRRGYPSDAINAFCREIGVTRNENMIAQHVLDHQVREKLDVSAKRIFVVINPLRVTLRNVSEETTYSVEAPDFPRDKALGVHHISLRRVVYIEKDDFRVEDSADYYGLAPGKLAGLRYAGYLKVVDVIRDASNEVSELICDYNHERDSSFLPSGAKVKGNLHWVSSSSPTAPPATAEVRLYNELFTSENPGASDDWEAELNPFSEVVVPNALIDSSLTGGSIKLWDKFQFERIGYFVADQDSDFNAGKLVFNKTVSLKEDVSVKKIKSSQ
jgi:glutaminyl-tRNA synthetase